MYSTDKMLISMLENIEKRLLSDDDSAATAKIELNSIFDSIRNKYKKAENNAYYRFQSEKEMEIFAGGADILLCRHHTEDKTALISLQKENSIFQGANDLEGFEDKFWKSMTEESVFYTAIRRKYDNKYMGYCGIKNIKSEEYELSVEILREFHGYGYGRRALMLFMNTIYNFTGANHFKALVNGENVSSQKMCEKCGGFPAGIEDYLIHDEGFMRKYEYENSDQITDKMRETAAKFSVQPEKLLTHVLVYRFEL